MRVNGLLLSQIIRLDENLNVYRIENENEKIEDIDRPIREFLGLLKGLQNFIPDSEIELIKLIEENISITKDEIEKELIKLSVGSPGIEIAGVKPEGKGQNAGGKYLKLSKKRISNKKQKKNSTINKLRKTMLNKQKILLKKSKKI